MPTITVNVPEELKKRLDQHPEINWSAYLRGRFEVKVRQLKRFEELARSGKLGGEHA